MKTNQSGNILLSSIVATLIVSLILGLVFVFKGKSGVNTFPDQTYLKGDSFTNVITIKARAVNSLGETAFVQNILFTIIDTKSGEPLKTPILIPNDILSSNILTGQVYTVTLKTSKGSLVATDIKKY